MRSQPPLDGEHAAQHADPQFCMDGDLTSATNSENGTVTYTYNGAHQVLSSAIMATAVTSYFSGLTPSGAGAVYNCPQALRNCSSA
jgi:YD repeat-containing protein